MRRIRSIDRSLLAQVEAHRRVHQVLLRAGRADLWDDRVRYGQLLPTPDRVRATPVAGSWWLVGWNDNAGDASVAERVLVMATAADGVRLFLVDTAALTDTPGASLRGPMVHIDVVVPAERAVGGPQPRPAG